MKMQENVRISSPNEIYNFQRPQMMGFNVVLVVSIGHLSDLQGLFSEIQNLHTVNCIELQLMLT